MHPYIKEHGRTVNKVASLFLRSFGMSPTEVEDECTRLAVVCAFLYDNPDRLSWRGDNKPSLITEVGIASIAEKFLSVRTRADYPAPPGTKPDEVVALVLRIVYGYPKDKTESMKLEHQHAMSAENIVGALLERYIASVMESHNWVWCAGDIIKAIDFLHLKTDGKWIVLQVKNRNNTENSSSSAIRNGTEIQKWFRSFAKTGKTNWGAFPDTEFRSKLSEAGFQSFVETYLAANRSS